MAANQVSSYYAKFGFNIDQGSVNKLKSQINQIKKFITQQLSLNVTIKSVKVEKFKINKSALNAALKEAVGKGQGGLTLPISSFSINASALRSAVQKAYNTGVTLNVKPTAKAPRSPTPNRGRGNGRTSFLDRMAIGGLVGLGSGYGIMSLNERSEELQSSKVALNTITGGRGVDAFQWIKNQGNAQGFDYASQLPIFSNYLGASINKQGYDNSLTSYKDLTQYGLTHGADKNSMEKAMLAIGQMWSKGKIMGEELNTQLAEAKGFSGAKSIIADAYQRSIGGNLTGQKSEAALIAAMKKGLVHTDKVMPFATQIMGEQAAGGREAYLQTTGAQHNRFSNAVSNAVEVFGKGGFDQGMMRFFKFMADFLDKHSEDIRDLGRSFLDLEKAFERIVSGGGALSALLVPLFALIKTGFGQVTLLVAVLDDISVFVRGGDSVLGQLVGWLSDLTGINYNAIAVGIGVVGLAVTAAFSPMLATIAGLAALIEAYKYIQGIRNGKEGVDSSQTSLPSWSDLDAQNAKNSNWGAFGTLTGGYEGGGINTDKLKGNAILLGGTKGREYFPALTKVKQSFESGDITQDVYDRALTAAGGGFMNPDALASWISKTVSKRNNPNIFPAGSVPDIKVYLNGKFNNEEVSISDLLSAKAQFPQQSSQPSDQKGTNP